MGEWTREQVAEHNEEAILYDEYEEAIIGIAYRVGMVLMLWLHMIMINTLTY
jgi:hypothetical protein